jgi:hypothetical protein
MLISMPTGTSTIFGAFQAIFGSPQVKPDELRPFDKVMQIKKFAQRNLMPPASAAKILRCTIFSGTGTGFPSNQ